MKNMKWFTGACLLACGLAFLPACSDDENEAVAPVFPDKVEEIVLSAAGETAELAFTANADWTLTSSRLWCKFVSGEESLPMLVGGAGEQNVQVVITDDVWGFEEATAEVALNMGGQSQVIAKITRNAKGLVIEGYDNEHPVEITYVGGQSGSQTTISLNANFDWELSAEGLPEWLSVDDLPLKGFAGRPSDIVLKVTKEAKVSAQSGILTLKQLETGATYAFPVNYAGMGDKDFETSLRNVWNWNVAKEGDIYWAGYLTGDDDTAKESFPLQVEIATKDYDYQLVRLFDDGKGNGLKEPDQWNGGDFFTVEDNGKGLLSIPAFSENTGGERSGYILAFPRYVYETELQNSVDNALIEDMTAIKTEYEQYIVWNFTQQGNQVAATGFEVLRSGYESLECLQGDGGTGYGEMISEATQVPVDQIFHVKVQAGDFLQVNPKLTVEQWNPEVNGMNGMMIMSMEGEDFTEQWNPGMTMGGSFSVDGTVNKTMFISFSDFSAGYPMPCKALIIIVE